MRRKLLRSSSFVRAARRIIKKSPGSAQDLRATLDLLFEDAFDPRLRTHKLKGPLASSWACSMGYGMRIVFAFVESEGKEAILLQTIGTHEEVY
jgi:mRNA-degrading endonuclease YafQ of YafQ-DinJ toxin-antitoxin module